MTSIYLYWEGTALPFTNQVASLYRITRRSRCGWCMPIYDNTHKVLRIRFNFIGLNQFKKHIRLHCYLFSTHDVRNNIARPNVDLDHLIWHCNMSISKFQKHIFQAKWYSDLPPKVLKVRLLLRLSIHHFRGSKSNLRLLKCSRLINICCVNFSCPGIGKRM